MKRQSHCKYSEVANLIASTEYVIPCAPDRRLGIEMLSDP